MPSEYLLYALIVVALLNGGNIVMNRIFNARLAMHVGAMRSSYWNHLVGFIGMVIFVLIWSREPNHFQNLSQAPVHVWFGGIVGVGFVWLINRVILLLGAVQTMLVLLVSQMVFGLLADIYLNKVRSVGWAIVGIIVLVLGMNVRLLIKTKK